MFRITKTWLLIAALAVCGTVGVASCAKDKSASTEQSDIGKVAEIKQRGMLLSGTTGDYRPLSFREENGTYWGFGIEMTGEIAKRLGVSQVQVSRLLRRTLARIHDKIDPAGTGL